MWQSGRVDSGAHYSSLVHNLTGAYNFLIIWSIYFKKSAYLLCLLLSLSSAQNF